MSNSNSRYICKGNEVNGNTKAKMNGNSISQLTEYCNKKIYTFTSESLKMDIQFIIFGIASVNVLIVSPSSTGLHRKDLLPKHRTDKMLS